MAGILIKNKRDLTNELFVNNCVQLDKSRSFLIRSEYSKLLKLFLEFDYTMSDEIILNSLKKQIDFYLSYFPSEWITAFIWEDKIGTVITLCPMNGAA